MTKMLLTASKPSRFAIRLGLLCVLGAFAYADAGLNAQSGIIQMPDARLEDDGDLRMGLNFQRPYRDIWMSESLMPWLEFSAKYRKIDGVYPFSFSNQQFGGYGDYGDKSFGIKLLLSRESEFLPALAVGQDDIVGNQLFLSRYIVASKQLGAVDATLGYGQDRIDGVFGGLKYRPEAISGLSLKAEWDANNYKLDPFATGNAPGASTGLGEQRKKGVNVGVGYEWGWLNAQVDRLSDGTPAFNLYLKAPLNQKAFIPKIDEPKALTVLPPRPTERQWLADRKYSRQMVHALSEQDFSNVRVRLTGATLEVDAASTRVYLPSRAAGRAARIAMAYAPFNVRELRIMLRQGSLPMMTYTFADTQVLEDYFNGKISREALAKTVGIRYAGPQDEIPAQTQTLLDGVEAEKTRTEFNAGAAAGQLAGVTVAQDSLSHYYVAPHLGTYFNDPSGLLKYDLDLQAGANYRLADQTFLVGNLSKSIAETVSQVTQASNSLLPHVRSDVADYERHQGLKIETLVANQFFDVSDNVRARVSGGLYEMMYGGVGGQIMYMPERMPVTFDLEVDHVRQRDYTGGFGFLDYQITTAIASTHYRMPELGLTATVRAGRFLAGDVGERFELTRRFNSGVEVGAWYTVTNLNDITSPGSPQKPYRDKGVMLTWPVNITLTKDTDNVGSYSLSPWTRDVGQMVSWPADLYDRATRFINSREARDGLVDFGDVDDNYPMRHPMTLANTKPLADFGSLLDDGARNTLSVPGLENAMIAGGIIWASSRADNRINNKVGVLPSTGTQAKLVNAGDAIPWVGLAGAGALSLYEGNDRLSGTAYTAFLAGAEAGALAKLGSWAVGRARPLAGQGDDSFSPRSGSDSYHSFPSTHVAVATAVVAPFAHEYDLPALYILPAITQYARIRSGSHWFSDTIAGSLLGLAVGENAWSWNHKRSKYLPSVQLGDKSANLTWELN